ncbi:MAG: efflux RND transporter periplasmic adaptor subunit [Thermodesulfobacteriota bacterium]|nr:efflux RND transporter periplasmic adaptor subunit [Thermodesulfobacteriota bacterium]
MGKHLKHMTVKKSIFILIILGSVAFFTCQGDKDAQTKPVEPAIEARPEVIVEDLVRGTIYKAYNAIGTVIPEDYARILPKVAGRISDIMVDEGDKVKKGQRLMQIETFDYARAVENARSIRSQASANLEKAQRDYERTRKLHESKAIAENIFDNATTAYNVAKYVYSQSQTAYKKALRDLDECTLTAPISGIVTNKYVNEGELIGPQTPSPCFVVMQMDRVKIQVDLPEEAYGYLKKGNKGFIRVDAIPSKTFDGTITKIYPTIDPASRTFKVTIQVKNEGLKLRSGMTARTEITLKTRTDTVYVSKAAIQTGETQYFVFRVKADTIEKTFIETGIEGDKVFEVKNGLLEGDRVVVRGMTGLRDHMKVRVVSSDQANKTGADASGSNPKD